MGLEYYDKFPAISNSDVCISEVVDQNAFFSLVHRVQIDE